MKTSELLEIVAGVVPDRIAIKFEGQELTYAELLLEAQKAAGTLQRGGVKKGDRVAILDVTTPQYLTSYFGCSMLGAMFVPFNFRAREQELRDLVADSSPTAFLMGPRYVSQVLALKKEFPNIVAAFVLEGEAEGVDSWQKAVAAAEPCAPAEGVEDSDPTLLIYTAGTTGKPKGVINTHESFTEYVLQSMEMADPERHDINVLVTPLYHVAGFQGVISSVWAGRTLVLLRQFDAEPWLQAVQEHKATLSVLVPAMLRLIVDQPNFSQYDLSSLRQITYGAAAMPPEVLEKAVQLMPRVLFFNSWGLSETAGGITGFTPEESVIDPDLPWEKKKEIIRLITSSIGRPLPGVEVGIITEDGERLPQGGTGEIVVRGTRVMQGYWENPQATADAIDADGWLHTGDLGYQDHQGFIWLTGRIKDLINRGGEKVTPLEVEQVILERPEVLEAAVFGVPDPVMGEDIAAAIVLRDGVVVPDKAALAEELRRLCHSRLGTPKTPKSFFFRDSLPVNPLGKVLRRELREEYKDVIVSNA